MSPFKLNSSRLITILVLLGVIISAFLLAEHYSPNLGEVCSFGESFDCGTVNKSPYSTADGIFYFLVFDLGLNIPYLDLAGIHIVFDFLLSNAFLGIITLIVILLLFRAHKRKERFLFIEKNETISYLKGITAFSVFYGLYLFIIQHFILRTYCSLCLTLDVIFVVLFVIVWTQK